MRLWLVLCVPLMAAPALANKPAAKNEGGLAIAAVVGDEAISSYDVDARLRFIVATTRLTNNPETLARVRPQVVRSLIDERLQTKAAAAENITVSDQEVASAIAGIESQRGMAAGAIAQMLAQNNVPMETFKNQIRAQLAWGKLVGKRIRPAIRISDEEALARQKTMVLPKEHQELEIAFMILPVDRPKRENEVRAAAAKLSSEMRAGASFEELSRQLSGRGTNVPSLWVRPEQLDPALGRALAGASAGTITPPIRTEAGYTIVKVYNARSLEKTAERAELLSVKEIVLSLKPDAENQEASALLSIAEEIAKHPGRCDEDGVAGIDNLEDVEMKVVRREIATNELTQALSSILGNLVPGQISSPYATDRGIELYMLCARRPVEPSSMVDLGQVKNVILAERLELEAQKLMRNLRRDTFIEVR